MTNLENALRYADLGFKVFPCGYMTKRPITPNGFLDATTDENTIREWWTATPDANIAISVPDDVCILDIDSNKVHEEIKQYLPDTMRCDTPRGEGGYHYWYKLTPGTYLGPRVEFVDGIDLRCKGSYVLVPSSRHPNGGYYKWGAGCSPVQIQMADVPQWVIDEAVRQTGTPQPVDPESILSGVKEGGRQVALFRYAAYLRRKGMKLDEAKVLIATAAASAEPPWPEKNALSLVERVYSKYPDGSANTTSKKVWNVNDLLDHEFEKVEWVIKEILPPGFCVFSSDPKLGKSMIMGNLCVSVAEGTKAFGRFETSRSDVGYADMEQGEEFAKQRWNAILSGGRVKGKLETFFEWERIGDGCIASLRRYLSDNPKTRLFVIDILANVWPVKDLVSGTVYQKEYAIISQLAKVAKEFNVSIVGVHHKSKNKADKDNVMQASGSVGIVAAADVIWSLSRERDNPYGFLDVSGKNVETRKIRLLNTGGFKWTA